MPVPQVRSLPSSPEAERAVIGGCLLDRNALIEVQDILSPDDFFDAQPRRVFEVMCDMTRRERPVDVLTTKDELNRRGDGDPASDQNFLVECADMLPTAANAAYYARTVQERALRRRVIQAGQKIAQLGYEGQCETEELLEEAERMIFEISRRRNSSNFQRVGDLLSEAIEQIQAACARDGDLTTGVPTGFSELDRLTGGLQRGALNILAARPSMGKTALALNVARNVAVKQGKPVLVFSLEMGALQLAQRLLGAEARINIHDMFSGLMQGGDWVHLTEAASVLDKVPLYIDDRSLMSTMELKAQCRRFKAQHEDLGLIVVDYLQLMNSARQAESKQQEVAEISRGLKAVARELDVPVLALSQLSRAVESRNDKRPQLSDLRDSGAIEQDADLVAFLFRPEYYDKDKDPEETSSVSFVDIAKHRNGPTGTANLVFIKEFTRFEDASTRLDPSRM